jgi:hypothetical protein
MKKKGKERIWRKLSLAKKAVLSMGLWTSETETDCMRKSILISIAGGAFDRYVHPLKTPNLGK